MPDKIFFPFMAAIIIGMVWLASQRSPDACPTGSVSAANTDYVTIKISGPQLNRFLSGQTLSKAQCRADSDYLLTLTALALDFPSSPDAGPHFRLAPDIEVAFSNRKVRISMRARATAQNGASGFQANYHTGPEGASGWVSFPLTKVFEDYTFDYQVPPADQDQGVDFLGIRPISVTVGDAFEIESLTFLNLSLQSAQG